MVKANVLEIPSKMTENLAKYHYDQEWSSEWNRKGNGEERWKKGEKEGKNEWKTLVEK